MSKFYELFFCRFILECGFTYREKGDARHFMSWVERCVQVGSLFQPSVYVFEGDLIHAAHLVFRKGMGGRFADALGIVIVGLYT
jgi:hypothetical protein